ncbi:hypothetical protein PVK06_042444 [Gossypium arboreum]|uniref:Uncharacterized protein n=1 Tax=Gossypium arboreum TaxID=29729 RepID=A0ABR0ML91_GOSAR|nr:hypothetical protein PVK06_042444 [Gossypium arboreum]
MFCGERMTRFLRWRMPITYNSKRNEIVILIVIGDRQLGEKASVEYIENSGHIVQLERPFKYNSCLNKILPSLSSS